MRLLLGIIDRLAVAALAACIVLVVLLVAHPWQQDIAAHDAQPIDCNDLIIRRWETADGVEILPSEVVPLWRYVQEPDFASNAAEWEFRSAFESDLHASDPTFHTTHELIDGQEW